MTEHTPIGISARREAICNDSPLFIANAAGVVALSAIASVRQDGGDLVGAWSTLATRLTATTESRRRQLRESSLGAISPLRVVSCSAWTNRGGVANIKVRLVNEPLNTILSPTAVMKANYPTAVSRRI
jgi:hypothetical protein